MEIGLLAVIVIAAWVWLDGIKAREIAVETGQQAAEKYGLQFLDESVALTKLRVARDGRGHMQLKRTYGFEVSDTGANRLACSVTLLGKRVESVDMPPYRDNNVVRIY
ncbi:MAG: DUF3301 domain-containing protein [Methylobacillus sp.]|jgi:hypothetical protein|nr:DUF3301 domain-containing protein [Methylobacillus sp.]